MFESLYDSPWTATFALALISVIGFAVWLRRQTFLVAYVACFTVIALCDALQSGSWSPLHLLSSPLEEPIALLFVLVGDYRYLLLMERYAWRPDTKPTDTMRARAWISAFALTAIVPLITLGLARAFPTRFVGRWNYLAWELAFVLLVLVLRFYRYPRRLAPATSAVRRWLFAVTHFELATYALWALADIVILAGADAGFALRIVPNVLYYGVFVFFVAFRAPDGV